MTGGAVLYDAAGVALYDLDPREVEWLLCPDAAWLRMLPLTPLRRGRSPRCYETAAGTPVHVRPDCRCPRGGTL